MIEVSKVPHLARAFAVALAASVMGISAVATACPPGRDGWTRPVANDRGTAASLLRQASALETEAGDLDASARAADQRSLVLERRARLLRVAASSAAPGERRRLLDQAFDLEGRADDERVAADGKRDEARQLRTEARRLRERAVALGGNRGGGWGIRPPTI